MNIIEKHLNNSNSREYYKREVEKLDIEQKEKLEKLLQKMENAGAKNPLSWAMSEITEGIPQFGRFLMLKGLNDITCDVEGNICLADDVDEYYENDIYKMSDKIKKIIGETAFNEFLKSYTKGVMWQVANLIDDGNYNQNNEPGWALSEVNNDGKTTGKFIGGLHESLNDFEEEV